MKYPLTRAEPRSGVGADPGDIEVAPGPT